ncbi:hypothetical protein HDV05_002219, partial [Chytridiales sp. JEL 0842]
MAKLGTLPALRKLSMPCNDVKDLDLEMAGKFGNLEELDLSFNQVSLAALVVLATLPKLRELDLTSNGIYFLPQTLMDMSKWRDAVIEYLLPNQVAILDALANMKLENLPVEAWKEPKTPEPPKENKVEIVVNPAKEESQSPTHTQSDSGDDDQDACVTVKVDLTRQSTSVAQNENQELQQGQATEPSPVVAETTEEPSLPQHEGSLVKENANSLVRPDISTPSMHEIMHRIESINRSLDQASDAIQAYNTLEVLSLENNMLSSHENLEILATLP